MHKTIIAEFLIVTGAVDYVVRIYKLCVKPFKYYMYVQEHTFEDIKKH